MLLLLALGCLPGLHAASWCQEDQEAKDDFPELKETKEDVVPAQEAVEEEDVFQGAGFYITGMGQSEENLLLGQDRRKRIPKLNLNINPNDPNQAVNIAEYIVPLWLFSEKKTRLGTGTIVGITHNTVYILTCAHNVTSYDGIFSKYINVSKVFFTYKKKHYRCHACYPYEAYFIPDEQTKHDLAMLTYKISGLGNRFPFPYTIFPKIGIPTATNYPGWLIGYPGEKEKLGRLYGMQGMIHTSEKRIAHYHDIDTSKGQSGSALLACMASKKHTYQIIGVHGGAGAGDYNYGIKIDLAKHAWIQDKRTMCYTAGSPYAFVGNGQCIAFCRSNLPGLPHDKQYISERKSEVQALWGRFTGRTLVAGYLKRTGVGERLLALPGTMACLAALIAPTTNKQVVAGAGGMGKSTLARLYGQQCYNQGLYQEVWWFHADATKKRDNNASPLEDSAKEVCDYLGCTANDEQNLHQKMGSIRAHLAQTGDWLLIFDNATTFSQYSRVIPKEARGHILITSRNAEEKTWHERGILLYTLAFLDLATSKALLNNFHIPADTTETKAMDALLTKIERFPLIVSQIGHYIKEQAKKKVPKPYARYLATYQRQGMRIASLQSNNKHALPSFFSHTGIVTTFELTLEAIKEESKEEALKETWRILRVMSFLDPDGVDVAFFEHLRPSRKGKVNLGFLYDSHATIDKDKAARARDCLQRYGLLIAKGGTLRAHRTIYAVVRWKLTQQKGTIPSHITDQAIQLLETMQRTSPQKAEKLRLRMCKHAYTLMGYVEQDMKKRLRLVRLMSEIYSQTYLRRGLYLPPTATNGKRLHEQVLNFITSTKKSNILLLQGEAGTGKSTYGCYLEGELWKSYAKRKIWAHIPIFISLPAFCVGKHIPKDLVRQALLAKGLHDATIMEMQQRARSGKQPLVFILDGYDEIEGTVNLYKHCELAYWETKYTKFIITCRTSYLEGLGTGKAAIARLFQGGSQPYQQLTIAPFGDATIRNYITAFATSDYNKYKTKNNPLKEKWDAQRYQKTLQRLPSLRGMMTTPFLLVIGLAVLPSLDKKYKDNITLYHVYDSFTSQWIKREVDKPQFSNKDKKKRTKGIRAFCEDLAQAFLAQHGLEIAKEANTMKRFLHDDAFVHAPLRKAAHNGKIYYQFIQPQFRDFFIASKMVAEILRGGKLEGYRDYFATYGEGYALNQRLLRAEVPIVRFIEGALRVRDAQGHPLQDYLWEVILASKKNAKLGMASNNAMTILNAAGCSFAGKDLSGIHASVKIDGRWQGPNLVAGFFARTNFRNADLRGSFLRDACFAQANLSKAQLYEANFGLPRCTLRGHVHRLWSVAFAPDGETLASGGEDDSVKIWHARNGECVRTLQGHTDSVKDVCYAPDGETLASASGDGSVKIWRARNGECLHTLTGHASGVNSVAFAPDGETLASGGFGKSVKIWLVQNGQCLRTLTGHTSYVLSVCYAPDGRTLASASKDKSVKIWDVGRGECLRTLVGHTDYVQSVCYSPDGRTLASAGGDRSVKIWDARNGRCLGTLKGHTDAVLSVCYAPDGKTLASAGHDKVIQIWDVQRGECLRTITGHTYIFKVCYAPDGRTLASAGEDKLVQIWLVRQGLCLRRIKGHRGYVRSVCYAPGGSILASAGDDNVVKVWHAGKGTCLRTLTGHSSDVMGVAFSPDRKILASASKDNTLKLWNLAKGTCLRTMTGHTAVIHSVCYAPDGKTLASAGDDNSVKIWHAESGECVRTLKGHNAYILSVCYAPDGKTLASAGDDNTVKIWHAQEGQCLRTLKGHTVTIHSVCYAPDGKTLASARGEWQQSGKIKIWDAGTGACLRTMTQPDSGMNSICYAPDGKILVSANRDGSVKMWDVHQGTCLRTMKGHTSGVLSVAFSPDAQTLASASYDGSVKVWDAKTGHLIYNLQASQQQRLSLHGAVMTGATGINVEAMQEGGAVLQAQGVQEEKDNK